jgi:hypothetical protein
MASGKQQHAIAVWSLMIMQLPERGQMLSAMVISQTNASSVAVPAVIPLKTARIAPVILAILIHIGA